MCEPVNDARDETVTNQLANPGMVEAAEDLLTLGEVVNSQAGRNLTSKAFLIVSPPNDDRRYVTSKAYETVDAARAVERELVGADANAGEQSVFKALLIVAIRSATRRLEAATMEWDRG